MSTGDLSAALTALLDRPITVTTAFPVSGGCIHDTRIVETSKGERWFVKANHASSAASFQAEAAGLKAIAATQTVRTPSVIREGTHHNRSYLVLEALELRNRGDAHAFGASLANLHQHRADRFGFGADNFLGAAEQPNVWVDSWVEFYRKHRLGHQFRLAARNGYHFPEADALLEALPAFFTAYNPRPSLLHGDLWSGNAAYLASGEGVVFDPAAHYGDRECDLAMTELFGGFEQAFYEGYETVWPIDSGYAWARRDLYQLYHLLNHANLFGGSYASASSSVLSSLLNRI